MEAGEEETGVSGSGGGCIDRDGGDHRHAEDIGDVPLGQRPPILEHEDRPVEPPDAAGGQRGEADVARPPQHGVVLDRAGAVTLPQGGADSVERPGGDAASIDHDHVVPGGCDTPAGGRREVEVRSNLDHLVVA